ncbi:acyloxyacyl hydrolase [Candidatus Tisiphia endosymbiont of Oplodontha viridula]|uniref:acyloxyacyl hydrolase n=1 Tax=Candidatus Tisiphia endosymbiont of Oplodontha viridula TaxID=3077925 RepID=UPI0035C8D402
MNRLILLIFLSISFCLTGQRVLADEIRIGILKHDINVRFKHRYEKGCDFNFEYLLGENYKLLRGYPHIGADINNGRYASSVYTGLTWRFDITESMFWEISIGGAIHNGELKKSPEQRALKKRPLGSRLLFRESFSLGVKFNEIHAITLILDHISNADIVKPNAGLTNLGIRYGYKF